MKLLARSAAILLALGLTGCVSIGRVPAGPVSLSKGQSVNLQTEWADVSPVMPQRQNGVRVLSIDGPALNRLYLIQGIAPGQGLIKRTAKEKPVPTFRADLAPTEIVELVSDSVAALGYQKVETNNLRPGRFGTTDAIRFDLTALTPTGLDISGTAQVAVVDQKLIGALLLAPSEHYFPALLPQMEAMLGSAETVALRPSDYQASYEARIASRSAVPSQTFSVADERAAPEVTRSPPRATAAAVAIQESASLAGQTRAAVESPKVDMPPAPSQQCGFVQQANGVLKLVPCR